MNRTVHNGTSVHQGMVKAQSPTQSQVVSEFDQGLSEYMEESEMRLFATQSPIRSRGQDDDAFLTAEQLEQWHYDRAMAQSMGQKTPPKSSATTSCCGLVSYSRVRTGRLFNGSDRSTKSGSIDPSKTKSEKGSSIDPLKTKSEKSGSIDPWKTKSEVCRHLDWNKLGKE